MDGHQLVASLKHMSEIEDVNRLPILHTPVSRNPLPFDGGSLAIRGIQDAMMMVIGTDLIIQSH